VGGRGIIVDSTASFVLSSDPVASKSGLILRKSCVTAHVH
jgi:hypothetical protein